MAERRSRLQLVLLAAALVLFVGGFALFATAPDPERRGTDEAPAALRTVRTQRVELAPLQSRAEVASVLEARRSVQLFAETRGPVLEVGAEALDRVESGQMLLRIDPLEATVAVERARAAVARGESQRALAQASLERQQGLRKQGVASAAVLDEAENAAKVAQAELRQARAELEQAEDDLRKKTVLAPFAGVLRSFDVEAGEFVQPGQPIGELLDLTTARGIVGLSDRDVVDVRAGQSVEAQLEAWPGERFHGRVLRVGAASDLSTKKFPVEFELPNPDGRLLPGMVAMVSLDVGGETRGTVIPRDASIDEFGLRFVWGIEQGPDGLVARRRRVEVRAIPFRPADLEVLSGLGAGEEIAVSGIRQLRDGERVRREEDR